MRLFVTEYPDSSIWQVTLAKTLTSQIIGLANNIITDRVDHICY